MFSTVIEAIKRLESNESPSKTDQELLDYLYAEADKEINANLLNLMTYGDRLGWERIEVRLTELLNFIRSAKR
uniref:Uncharacterized protein n=1 Tax=Candidatus Kentrum sp. MB TaxID=2138164 RepID=A0A450X9G9_9GAMM|nr:MAG: hypothetical protein BECKMB1821G_GA0114241_101727 [Candidatus Kentron sp. MB]VFK33765.1 MAG: hypothetical protein BECKMB1821I_GA0114274_10536 [Candidatus Kentron sp. MB]VFK76371.1 MAG: hypothetical protein BECKMB1821H_GA0114242_10546 [Candidatus Kentron sp. MB]